MSFKESAYEILKGADKPLRSEEITKIALDQGMIKTDGKTPVATMNARISEDIKTFKEKSRFVRTAKSTYRLNKNYVPLSKLEVKKAVTKKVKEKNWSILKDTSSAQKGDITKARVAEFIKLYGDTTLSCYKSISNDEEIDLIVKKKGSFRTMHIQVESLFSDNFSKIFTSFIKRSDVAINSSMAIVFCIFDTEEGDHGDHLWFIPAPDFIKLANKEINGRLGFTVGSQKSESNKWDEYLIDKRELASRILAQMNMI